MKQATSIIIFLATLLGQAFGQTDTGTVYKNLDTRKSYSVELRSLTSTGGEKDIYEVNGRKVNKRIYDKYQSTWKNMETCCPCILKYYDENDNLISESVSCTDCGVGWFKEFYPNGKIKRTGHYKENPTDNWKNLWDRGYCSVKDKQWTYFKENGDTLYSEFWNNGKFIKQVPEQSITEIWDIELTLNELIIDTQIIAIKQIGNLKINPKYKNSNTNSKLTLKFNVSANGHRGNEKQFSIKSFQNIDVSSMLSEVNIPKDKKTTFLLSIYNNGQGIKLFYLNVKK